MAAFGIPLVREHDALRAVRAAADLQARLRVLAERVLARHGRVFGVRFGINTGEVVGVTRRRARRSRAAMPSSTSSRGRRADGRGGL